MSDLWPHQERSIQMLRDALRSGSKRPVLQLPTGAGKTRTASEIIGMARAKGSRVIFTVPAISLIDQTVRAFWAEGIREVGVIQANHEMTDPSRPVQIASVQTLARRELPAADLVIVDECHRQSEFLTGWLGREDWASVPFIGLSATPWANGMARLWDRLIIGSTTADLIEAGVLSPFKVWAPSHPDLAGVKVQAGDYVEGQLSEAMQKGTLTADIVTTWLEKGEGRPTLVFAVDRAHAAKLQVAFQAVDVPTGYIDANTSLGDRENIRKAMACGALKVVCNVGVLTTGVDWDVRCLVMARPTKSEILYAQIIGRGLRTAPGKDHLIILDHSDTTLELGFVTDIHHEKLKDTRLNSREDDARQAREPKPWECKPCQYVVPAGVYTCPMCGFKRTRQSSIEPTAGELKELGAASRKQAANLAQQTSVMAQFKAFALMRGRAPGWVYHSYLEFFGEPPSRAVSNTRTAQRVTPEVASWIKAKSIRYAKQRQAEQEAAALA